MTRKRRCISLLLTLAVLTILVLYILASVRPARTVRVFTSPQERESAMHDIERQVESVKQASALGERRPVSIEVREEVINDTVRSDPKVAERLRSQGVENPSVTFGDEGVTVTADVRLGGRMYPVTATGTLLDPSQGRGFFEPTSIRIGYLPVPASVTNRIAERLRTMSAKGMSGLPVDIQSIRVEQGKVVVEGVSRPINH